MSIIRSNKGVTLIEIVLATGLIALVVTLGYMFYFTGVKAFDRNVERADIQQNVRHSIGFISKRLFNAKDAEVSVTTRVNASDEIIIGKTRFKLTGTTLEINHDRENPASPFNPLAERITAFEVTRAGRMITVIVTGGTARESNLFTLSMQVLLRR